MSNAPTASHPAHDVHWLLNQTLLRAFLAAFALTVCLGVIVTQLPLRIARVGGNPLETGLAFSTFAATAMVVMLGPGARWSDRVGRKAPMVLGLLGLATAMSILGVWASYLSCLGAMAVFGAGFGFLFPAATAQVADGATAQQRGRAYGAFYALYSAGVAAGSAASGGLVELSPNHGATAAFLLAGLTATAVAAKLHWGRGVDRATVAVDVASAEAG